MNDTPGSPPYTLGPDEKSTGVMIYTATGVSWGEVLVKNQIRVSTWLRTNAAPEIICLYNAKTLFVSGGGSAKVLAFREQHISANQVLAYHLIPPAREPIDYDPTEPNRRMDPVSVLIGQFRLDGSVRVASRTTLATHLEISRETYSPLYDVEVTCPILPSLKPVRVFYALVRHQSAAFGVRNP